MALCRWGTDHLKPFRQTESVGSGSGGTGERACCSTTLLGGPGTCGLLCETALIESEGGCSPGRNRRITSRGIRRTSCRRAKVEMGTPTTRLEEVEIDWVVIGRQSHFGGSESTRTPAICHEPLFTSVVARTVRCRLRPCNRPSDYERRILLSSKAATGIVSLCVLFSVGTKTAE